MFKNKTKASEATQILLIEQLTCWKNKNISNENQAFSYFYQKSKYFLKMLWQGRFNKLSDKDKELNLWISENYLPKEYNLDTKNIDKLSLQLLNLEINQEELVQQVLKNLWIDYLNSNLDIKPPKEKKGFLRKLFS